MLKSNIKTFKKNISVDCSLLRRETNIPGNQPEIEHYRFTANGNLQAYMYENLLYVHYGYNAANTRTYKYSFDLNPNWVNGRLENVSFNPHTAMFYPNSYLNFNSNGYYTKHYYNGTERIASRLGGQNLPINVNDPELQDRKDWQDSLIRKNVTEITGYEFLPVGEEQNPEDPKPVFELPQVGITNLIQNTSSVYYYHPNHLGSTCYVTNENATVQQGFLYAPFGEITNEHNSSFGNGVIPKYSFNAKELDEETGFYYYEARYYAPPVFTSRDPLFEKYPTFSPYAYCVNNPVKFIDPTGEDIELNFFKGKNKERSTELFKSIINYGLQGQFEVYYTKGKIGKYSLQLRATENGGDLSKLSPEAKAFYENLSSMINDHTTTAVIDVVYGSSEVRIGHYQDNKIDIADINNFDNMGKGAATKQGKLIHELVEQFGKAKKGHKKGESYGREYNHKKGIAAENKVNGTIRKDLPYNRGIYTSSYTDKSGKTTTYSYKTNQPILKVTKQ